MKANCYLGFHNGFACDWPIVASLDKKKLEKAKEEKKMFSDGGYEIDYIEEVELI